MTRDEAIMFLREVVDEHGEVVLSPNVRLQTQECVDEHGLLVPNYGKFRMGRALPETDLGGLLQKPVPVQELWSVYKLTPAGRDALQVRP